MRVIVISGDTTNRRRSFIYVVSIQVVFPSLTSPVRKEVQGFTRDDAAKPAPTQRDHDLEGTALEKRRTNTSESDDGRERGEIVRTRGNSVANWTWRDPASRRRFVRIKPLIEPPVPSSHRRVLQREKSSRKRNVLLERIEETVPRCDVNRHL